MKKNVIEVNAVAKQFGEIRAVDGVDLAVQEGEIFGILPSGLGERVAAIINAGEVILGEQVELTGRVYSYSITPVPKSRYVNLYATDITARVKAEKVLLDSKKELAIN